MKKCPFCAEEIQEEPYWINNSEGEMMISLPSGKYAVSYPDGLDADPLRIKVTVSWEEFHRSPNPECSASLETLVSMTPGRFRG